MPEFGVEDASYLAAGASEGLGKLVDAFYLHMDQCPRAKVIRAMHAEDLGPSREKLKVFLAGWLGGPRNYATRFGPIRIPTAHKHLAIDEDARAAWMHCMELAANEQEEWKSEFRSYFLEAISHPARVVTNKAQAAAQLSDE
jgi:hemoglobin